MRYLLATLSILTLLDSAVAAEPFDCEGRQCGLQLDGSYPHQVVGTLTAIAKEKELLGIQKWAHQNGWWAALPRNNDRELLESVAMVAIATKAGPVTMLFSPEELKAVPMNPGDLVRYAPHAETYPVKRNSPNAAAYHAIIGCVVVLCRASDVGCFDNYTAGVFRVSDGVEVDPRTGAPVAGGTRIDPGTALPTPKQAQPKAKSDK